MDRKYSVVIVDDNSIALKAITTTTDWEKLRCRVVGTATDGITGLNLVKEHAPVSSSRTYGCLDMMVSSWFVSYGNGMTM